MILFLIDAEFYSFEMITRKLDEYRVLGVNMVREIKECKLISI